MKFWYQSLTNPEKHAEYFDRLGEHLESISSDGVEIRTVGMDPSAADLHPLTEFRCAQQVVRNSIRAEEEGFDAFLLGHFQDAGLDESRATVGLPVLGLGETSMLVASLLGRKLGLVTINPIFISWHQEQVSRYGFSEWLVGVESVDTEVTNFTEGFRSEAAYEEIFDAFTAKAEELVAQGAEVILPAGGLPMLLLSREDDFKVGKAPVLNGITVLEKMAELAVDVKGLEGVVLGNRPTLEKPSEQSLRDFLETFADNPS